MDTAGCSRQQIATALDCSQGWISQVLHRQRQLSEGASLLPKTPAGGPTPLLQPIHLEGLKTILQAEAIASGFDTDGWTRQRVVRVIEEQYGIKHSPSHISRILHKIGFTLQKPQSKDYRRDEQAVQQWKETTLPATKKKR